MDLYFPEEPAGPTTMTAGVTALSQCPLGKKGPVEALHILKGVFRALPICASKANSVLQLQCCPALWTFDAKGFCGPVSACV